MKLSIIGTGYVGLVCGTCLAEMGNHVICVDNNQSKIDLLNQGNISMYEPGLHPLFDRNKQQNRLIFTTDLISAVKSSDIIFLALPTPMGADGAADLSAVIVVASQLSDIIDKYTIIVNKSTVPVGTGQKVNEILLKKLDNDLFDVVSNPEFLREGAAVGDFMKPERIVIGSESERAINIMNKLYEPFVRQGNPIIAMDIKSAELSKYAANAFLATKITFMNEIANLSEKVGANVDSVRRVLGTDSRIGKRFLFAGVGFGGSCFPKDVNALYQSSQSNEYDFKILDAVLEVNARQRVKAIDMISKHYPNLDGKKIAVWGLSFKPNTDDVRQAPSLYTIQKLLDMGAEVNATDPEAIDAIKQHFGDKINYFADQYLALENVDGLIILTEWSAYRTPEFDKIKSAMKSPLIIDGRNVFNPIHVRDLGFIYESVGRP